MPAIGDTITPEHLSAETRESKRALRRLADKFAPEHKRARKTEVVDDSVTRVGKNGWECEV